VTLRGTTSHYVVDACQSRLLDSRLELVETHIAACAHRIEATLVATSVACNLHVPQTVGTACYVFNDDNIPFHEQDVSCICRHALKQSSILQQVY